jgi:hypothetical protein
MWRWSSLDNEFLRALQIAPVDIRRVAVLRHRLGGETSAICQDQDAAVQWLAENYQRNDQIMIVDVEFFERVSV